MICFAHEIICLVFRWGHLPVILPSHFSLLGPRCKSTKTREQNCKDAMAKMQKAKVLSSESKGAILHNFELLPYCNLICTFAFYFLSNNLMQVSYLPMVCFMLSNVVMYAFSLKGEGKSAKARMRSCEGGGEIVLSLFHVTLSS